MLLSLLCPHVFSLRQPPVNWTGGRGESLAVVFPPPPDEDSEPPPCVETWLSEEFSDELELEDSHTEDVEEDELLSDEDEPIGDCCDDDAPSDKVEEEYDDSELFHADEEEEGEHALGILKQVSNMQICVEQMEEELPPPSEDISNEDASDEDSPEEETSEEELTHRDEEE